MDIRNSSKEEVEVFLAYQGARRASGPGLLSGWKIIKRGWGVKVLVSPSGMVETPRLEAKERLCEMLGNS